MTLKHLCKAGSSLLVILALTGAALAQDSNGRWPVSQPAQSIDPAETAPFTNSEPIAPLDETWVSPSSSGFLAGGDYLFIRPHFSEAVAFAAGTQTPASFDMQAVGLDFNYDSSLRAFLGYRTNSGSEVRFTYWNMRGDVAVNGAAAVPGTFIIDPFGGVVGAFVNPLTGLPVAGGDAIATRATVNLNICDIDYILAPLYSESWFTCAAFTGVRIADIDQTYRSVITTGGAVLTEGDFFARFTGAGLKLGLILQRDFFESRFGIYVNGQTSLLLGSYEVGSSFSPVPGFTFSQAETMTRLIPTAEMEVGARWSPTSRINVSAGWMFQSWFDLGTSGGQFAGLFGGADDANIMSFDGLTARVEVRF